MASCRRIVAEAKHDQFKVVGVGSFADVYGVVDTEIAFKIPFEQEEPEQATEEQIYERLGTSHPFILRSYGEAESVRGKGLMLEYLPTGILAKHLELEKFPVERTQWPVQAAEAIRYIHSKGVIHCDIGTHNFLIQKDGSLALADFWGSSLDGSTAIVSTSTRYTRPLSLAERLLDQTETDDIFALGTVIYEISVGHRLYAEKSDSEIYQLFQKREFPDTTGLALRAVIDKCWRNQYSNAEEVKLDLASERPTRQHLLQYLGLSLGVLLVLFEIGRNSLIGDLLSGGIRYPAACVATREMV